MSFGFFVEISAGGRYESYLLWTEGRELIFGLLEGLSLTSLISYSPSNQGNEKEYESEEGERQLRKAERMFNGRGNRL